MPLRDSDEDMEPKTGRRTRILTTSVDSPIRRSNRIKQSAKLQKSSPGSESDTSVSSNQPVRTTRQRIATMDSITAETLKGRSGRKPSISSETSEIIDIDTETPSKRTTRRSFTTATVSTPTRASTRVASKRFVRAGSETKSPPSSRTTRRTRASSVDPETMSDQNKNVPSVSTKIRKRASVLPSQSPVKEEIEEKQDQSDVKTDILDEVEEFIGSDNDSLLDKVVYFKEYQNIKEIDNTNKDKVDEDNSSDEILAVASDETSQQLANNEIYSKHTVATREEIKKNFNKIQSNRAEDLSSDIEIEVDDEISTDNINAKKDTKENKFKVIEKKKCLTETEASLIDMYKTSSTKELTVRLENIFDISTGEQKKNPSNKENQTLNIINDTSTDKDIGPIITNVTSLSTKSLTTVFANKSLNEKEIKFKNEPSLGNHRHSKESTETAVKHATVLKKSIDSIEKITDSSIPDSLNFNIINEKKKLDDSSIGDITNRQSLTHDVDKKSTITNDTIKPISLPVKDTELVEEIIDDHVFKEKVNKTVENATEVANKLDKSVTNTEICDETTDSKENSLTVNDNSEMILKLEESNASQDKNKSLNESMKTMAESNFDHSNESIDVETYDDESIAVDKLAPIIQEARDDLLDSAEQTKKNVSNYIAKSTSISSSTTLETINSFSNDLNADNATIQNIQSDVMEISEESIVCLDVLSKKAELNTSSKIAAISTQENTLVMSVEEKSAQLNQEDQGNIKDKKKEVLENMEVDDDKSDVDVISMFRDIPADKWKEDTVETRKAIEDKSNLVSVENESETECDLVLVDKQAWLAAETIKAVRDKECFEYDSDDTVLLKSRSDITQANKNKKRLSTINEALLINIDDEEEEEEQEKEEEGEREVAKPIKTRKSSIKEEFASEKYENSSTINVNSSNSADKFLNKSSKDLNQSSSRSASRLNESRQTVEGSVELLHKSDDEIRDDADRLNRSLQVRKNASLRKSTEKRESLSKSSKDTSLRQSSQNAQNNSAIKSQANNSKEEFDIETKHIEKKKKKRSLNKSKKCNKDAEDIDEVESESKKSSSSEKSGKENKDINVEDSNEDDENTQNNDLKKSDFNYSTLVLVGSLSNNSNKSSDDTTEDPFKHVSSLFELDSDISNDDDDGIGSINSDIKREYNLDAVEQEYSDDNVPYDECRTSESESSDPDDTGSDLADFIVADDAIEGEKNEEEEKEEQNDEDDEEEIQEDEDEATEQEKVENKDVDDEQVENAEEENDSVHTEEDEDEKSVRAETNVNKNNASDKSLKIGKSKRKISTEHVACQSQKREDIKTKKSHMKVEETNTLNTSGSTLSIKKRKSHVDETEQNSVKRLNESEINRRKLLKAARISECSMECSTPKINSSKEEFANNIEIAVTALEDADKKLNSRSEMTQRKKRKSKQNSISKEDLSFKEPKRTNNEEKLLHTSLPSDLLESVEKARPMSKITKLNKTMNVTHTETPTIRDLRKEKLNESAPEMKLKAETGQLQKRRLSKEKGNIGQKKTDKIDSNEEVPNLIAFFNDNIQELNHENFQRKQKKRKKQAEEILNENITEDILQDAIESDISKQQKKKKKKEKSDDFSLILTVQDTIPKDTYQLIEKKKKKKIDATKTDENVKKDCIQREDIYRKEKETLHIIQDEAQHSKKKKKREEQIIVNECDNAPPTENIIVKKRAEQHEIADSQILLKESLKKKKEKKQKEMKEEENIPLSQTGPSNSKLNFAKKMESEQLQLQNIFLSKTVESKNTAFIKARSEVLEAIKSATERIKLNKKLKKNKRENISTIQEQDAKIPREERFLKRKKTEKHLEKQEKILPPTCGLKRLSDNVIDKLSGVPTRIKRRKLSQNIEQIIPSLSMKNPKFLETKVKNRNFIPLSSSGSTTQFAIVKMSKTKKQPSKTITSIMSYKQRMLGRNSREPISSYLMYMHKQRAMQKSVKDGFSDNAF